MIKFVLFIFLILSVQKLSSGSENSKFSRQIRQTNNCGIAGTGKGLINNGESFERGKWPWMVAMLRKVSNSTSKFFCGGNLISRDKVLTGEIKRLFMKICSDSELRLKFGI